MQTLVPDFRAPGASWKLNGSDQPGAQKCLGTNVGGGVDRVLEFDRRRMAALVKQSGSSRSLMRVEELKKLRPKD